MSLDCYCVTLHCVTFTALAVNIILCMCACELVTDETRTQRRARGGHSSTWTYLREGPHQFDMRGCIQSAPNSLQQTQRNFVGQTLELLRFVFSFVSSCFLIRLFYYFSILLLFSISICLLCFHCSLGLGRVDLRRCHTVQAQDTRLT